MSTLLTSVDEVAHPVGLSAGPISRGLHRLGDAMVRHRHIIQMIQWAVVVFYLALVIIPAFLPLPPDEASILNNLTRFAQFLFWGLWWPLVMVSMMTLGRVWCGVFCPEGTLAEWASRFGLGRSIPRWLTWSGWPPVAFLLTTIYGQLVSVYEYPKATLLVLGGSTVAAMAVGLLWGKERRVWCRHLCPANGVFNLLARLAPLHFKVDRHQWDKNPPQQILVCAPLVDVRRMTGTSECHACGRCSGHRNAVKLALRFPQAEILERSAFLKNGEAASLIFGLLGVATFAFQWSISPWFIQLKLWLADYLLAQGAHWAMSSGMPWWVLTQYPEVGDTFTWLDGITLTTFILGGGTVLAFLLYLCLWLADKASKISWRRLALGLIPVGGAGVVLGLSMLTLTQLAQEHIIVPRTWLLACRMVLLAVGIVASFYLGVRMIFARSSGNSVSYLAFNTATSLPGKMVGIIFYSTTLFLMAFMWLVAFKVW